MLRWVVRALLVVTMAVVAVVVVNHGRHGAPSTGRLVVDLAAQPSSRGPVRPSSPARRAKAGRAAVCATVTVPHEIVVDIRRQELWACRGPRLVFATKVTTGAVYKDEATPDGTWQIYAKQTHRWLSGPGYSVEVKYWMPYYRGYGIHDSPWQKMPYGTDDYLARGSHGCVQVPGAAMARLYAWAPVGATVHVED
jgi:hypothetical protein